MYCGGQDVYLPQTSEVRSSSRRSINKYSHYEGASRLALSRDSGLP